MINKEKILVLGNGFQGQAFAKEGFNVLTRDFFGYDGNEFYSYIKNLDNIDVIINCIGCTNTIYCENNFKHSLKVNGELVEYLKNICVKNNIKLVHISTGDVCDNHIIPCKETDHKIGHCNYVISKIYGESFCDNEVDLILRPRVTFGDFIPDGRYNLLKKIKKFNFLSTELNSLTSVHTVVESTVALLNSNKYGVYNIANDGFISMAELADFLDIKFEKTIDMKTLRKNMGIHLINSIMDLSKLKEVYSPPNIKEELLRCYRKIMT